MKSPRTQLVTSAIVALLSGGVASAASAQVVLPDATGFFEDRERGWFWYEVQPEEPEILPPEDTPPPPEPPAPEPIAVVVPPPPVADQQDPPPFGSAAWLRENLPKYRDRALDNPTPENVRAYFYLQKLTLDKATAFTDMQQRVVIGDPMLDEVGRRPTATYAANLQNQIAGAETDKQLREIAETAGIWFFYRSDCQFCHRQAPILEAMAETYGFKIIAIAIDNAPLPGGEFPDWRPDAGHAAKLGVLQTPTMFLAKAPDGFSLLAQGALSMDDFKRRILVAALNEGWISEDAFDSTRPVESGQVLPANIQPPEHDLQDPAELVEYLRANVRN